jgi:hypothetical protein
MAMRKNTGADHSASVFVSDNAEGTPAARNFDFRPRYANNSRPLWPTLKASPLAAGLSRGWFSPPLASQLC